MTQIIKAHGCKFAVESDGFVKNNAGEDRDRGVAAIEDWLTWMEPEAVRDLHAKGLAWIAADCSHDRPAGYDELEDIGLKAATAGWRRPDAVSLSVSASK